MINILASLRESSHGNLKRLKPIQLSQMCTFYPYPEPTTWCGKMCWLPEAYCDTVVSIVANHNKFSLKLKIVNLLLLS